MSSPPKRPDGRHPARTRRKRKRRPRALAIWETPTYWNLLTVPVIGLAFVCGQALVMTPLFVKIPFLQRHGWLAAPTVLGWLASVVYLSLRPWVHWHWNVSEELIQSTQPGRAPYRLIYPNVDFVALETYGPLLLARRASGETHLWPRWLRRSGETYTFELHFARLRLRPLRLPPNSATSDLRFGDAIDASGVVHSRLDGQVRPARLRGT